MPRSFMLLSITPGAEMDAWCVLAAYSAKRRVAAAASTNPGYVAVIAAVNFSLGEKDIVVTIDGPIPEMFTIVFDIREYLGEHGLVTDTVTLVGTDEPYTPAAIADRIGQGANPDPYLSQKIRNETANTPVVYERLVEICQEHEVGLDALIEKLRKR